VKCAPLNEYLANIDQCNVLRNDVLFTHFSIVQKEVSKINNIELSLMIKDAELNFNFRDLRFDDIDNHRISQFISFYTIRDENVISIPQEKVKQESVSISDDGTFIEIKIAIKNLEYDWLTDLDNLDLKYRIEHDSVDITRQNPDQYNFEAGGEQAKAPSMKIVLPGRSLSEDDFINVRFEDPLGKVIPEISNKYTKTILEQFLTLLIFLVSTLEQGLSNSSK
jgi:hypothetical protein